MLLMTSASDDLASDDVSSGALLQTRFIRRSSSDAFFKRILPDASKLQIKFLCSWTCSIRIFMNITLIMDHVHLNKLFSISNWWFLIPCYCQNSIGDLWNTLCSNMMYFFSCLVNAMIEDSVMYFFVLCTFLNLFSDIIFLLEQRVFCKITC